MGESPRATDQAKETDGLIHELLIRLDDRSFLDIEQSIARLISRHRRTCKDCNRRHRDLLDAYRESLPAAKQERLEELGRLLAGKIVEEFNEKKHIRYAVQAAIAQRKVDPAMEAFVQVLKRHRILERIAAAMARSESGKLEELVRELRLHTLENWPEKA